MSLTGRTSLPILLAASAFAQAPTQAPKPAEFEVASIRTATEPPEGQVNAGLHIDGAQVRGTSLSLRDYLRIAYRLKASQISGPEWIASERFDISATLPSGNSESQIPEMLQSLLADRFHVKAHMEKKEFPVYALLVGKGPLKLKETPPDANADQDEPKGTVNVAGGGSAAGVGVNLGHGSSWSFVPNRFEAKKLTMEQLAANLERFADRRIVDMTGLQSRYDLAFDVTAEDYRTMLIRSAVSAGVTVSARAMRLLDSSSSAGLIDAVQQLGLKLEPRKAPLDVLIVDDALKAPTAN